MSGSIFFSLNELNTSAPIDLFLGGGDARGTPAFNEEFEVSWLAISGPPMELDWSGAWVYACAKSPKITQNLGGSAYS